MWQKTAELRGHNEVIEMSQDEMQEYIKCATDIFHFSKYFYILTGEGERPIELREYQVRLVKMLTGKYYFKNEDGTDVVNAIGEKSERNNRIIMMGALDNLVKGAAGQAVQNMNLLFGFDEDEGLRQVPMFP